MPDTTITHDNKIIGQEMKKKKKNPQKAATMPHKEQTIPEPSL